MAERYLIDTSAVIKHLAEVFPTNGISFMDAVVDVESNISFISEIELLAWNPPNLADIIIYKEFIEASDIIGINDAIIAATAIVNELTLVADNDDDFMKVPGFKYVNPASMV